MNSDLYLKLKCVVFSVLKKWRLIVLVVLICGIGADVVRTVMYNPQYATSITATIETEDNEYSELEGTRDYITTLDYILNGQIVRKYVAKNIGVDSVDYNCTVSSETDSNIITLRVVSSSQKTAYMSLDNIIKWYRNNTERLNFQYRLYVLERPMISELPINSNRHMFNFGIGMAAGGLLICGILGFLEFMRETVKCPNDISRYIDSRLYAKIPYEKKRRYRTTGKKQKKTVLITSVKASFAFVEAIKKLRTRVEESAKHHHYKVFMITSALENEGKSSIAVNLAIALAGNGEKVILVDGDIRKPAVHKIMELDNSISINDFIKGDKEFEDVISHINRYNLDVVTARKDIRGSEELFQGDGWRRFIGKARTEYDFVIVDSSPAHFLNETVMLNENIDAVLLMIKQDMATRTVINETIDRLANVKDNVIGCIYNSGSMALERRKSYGYGYNKYGKYGKYSSYEKYAETAAFDTEDQLPQESESSSDENESKGWWR